VPGSFVDEALRWRHSDVLFTAPLDGHHAFVYALIEHQSSDDPLMAFRMMRYVTRIWDQSSASTRARGGSRPSSRWSSTRGLTSGQALCNC
jgi:predicted transposase/invertase (TIGR01784 family)